jgi:UDP-glucose 4-epimerase
VTVLGGTGLIGSAIARGFLDAGWRVTVFARHAPTPRCATLLGGATVVLGDVLSPTELHDAVDGADHVVDALGAPHPAASADAALAQFDAELPNLLGILGELRHQPGTSFTYISSGGAIYGDVDELPVAEDTPCNPISPYGVAKLAAERSVLLAARHDGLRVRILRVANAYGALQRPRTGQGLVAALLHGAATSTPVDLYGDGTTLRDYVEVRDVAAATVALAGHVGGDAVLNVGTGVGHRVDEVLALVESVTGTTIEVRRLAQRPTDVRRIVLDVRRLSDLVPWRPRSLEVGVGQAWAQWHAWHGDPVTAEAR